MEQLVHRTLLEDVIVGLYKIGAVKFGDFKLRSGVSSPVYIDLRSIVAYPELLKNISELVWLKVQSAILPKVDPTHRAYVCGVPYSALTIATSLCVNHSLPSLIVRKEAKVHGTKKLVEGILEDGKKNFVIVVEDVVTSGISISETVDKIKDASTSVIVTEAIAFLDRQQGGVANLNKAGVNVHSIVTLHLLAEVLEAKKHISGEMKDKIFAYVHDNQISLEPVTKPKKKELTFQERKKLCKSEFSRVVLDLMTEKKSNLVLAADVNSTKEVLHLADLLGPEICMLKTHVDMLDDFDAEFVKQLSELARKHRFLIFEDRKFADIGKTVKQQYTGGVYKIANWSHLVNCHLISGKTIVKALKEGAHEAATLHNTVTRGLLLIAQMSSVDANTNNSTAEAAYATALENEEFVSGFICQEKFPELLNLPEHDKADAFLYFTPGVHLQQDKTDNLGQHYNSPEYVVIEKKTDAIIVGTGICGQPTDAAKLEAAKLYRKLAWDAYEKKIHQ